MDNKDTALAEDLWEGIDEVVFEIMSVQSSCCCCRNAIERVEIASQSG